MNQAETAVLVLAQDPEWHLCAGLPGYTDRVAAGPRKESRMVRSPRKHILLPVAGCQKPRIGLGDNLYVTE